MTVAVRALTTSGAKAAQTYTPAWPTGITNGDVVYATAANISAGTVTPPAGWTQIGTTQALANTYSVAVYRHVYVTSDVSGGWVGTAASWYLDLIAFSGMDTTTPEDATPAQTAAFVTTTMTMPTVNVASTSGGMILYIMAGPGTSATTSGTGLTPQYEDTRVHLDTSPQSGSGTVTGPVVTFSATQSSNKLAAFAIPLRAAGVALYHFAPTSAAGAATPTTGGLLVRDPNNAGWIPQKKPNPLQRLSSALLTAPNVMSRCNHANFTAATAQLNSRKQHVALFNGRDVVFFHGNTAGIETTANLGTLTLTCVLEIPVPDAGGNSLGGSGSAAQTSGAGFQVTWGGQLSVTIPPGQYVKSDPVPIQLVAGQAYFERTYAVSTGQIPVSSTFPQASRNEFADSSTVSDLTALTNSITNTGTVYGLYGAQAITATPTGRALLPMVVLIGDSRMYGVLRANGMSWCDQVLEVARIPHLKLAMQGEQNIQFVGQRSLVNSDNGKRFRGRFLSGATDIVSNSSINDIVSSATYAQMQQRVLWAAALAADYGARFHQATIEPKTTSTDSFATANNQTPANAGQETIRGQFNAWLRDGAPYDTATSLAAATGASSATIIRAGAYGHPVTGVIDVAAAIEVTNGSGNVVWHPDAATSDGLHPGDSGHNMMAVPFVTYCATHFAAYAA